MATFRMNVLSNPTILAYLRCPRTVHGTVKSGQVKWSENEVLYDLATRPLKEKFSKTFIR